MTTDSIAATEIVAPIDYYAARILKRIMDRYYHFTTEFLNVGRTKEDVICVDPDVGSLIQWLGLAGLRGLLTLSDDDFQAVMEDSSADSRATAGAPLEHRLKLFQHVGLHYLACQHCQIVDKNHEWFAEVFDSVMRQEGAELASVLSAKVPALTPCASAKITILNPSPVKRCVPRILDRKLQNSVQKTHACVSGGR